MTGPVTCPTCGATNPAGASWCSLCHTSFLEPAPDRPVEREPAADPASTEPTVPPQSRGEPDPPVDPDQWAALLAAEEGHRPSRFEAAMTRRTARVLFAVGVIGALLLVSLVGMVLLARLVE